MVAKMKYIQIVFSFGIIPSLYAGTVQQVYIKDVKPAIKGGEIQIVCEISGFTSSDVVSVYKTDSQPPQSLTGLPSVTNCIPSLCLGSIDRHTFSADSSKVTITVNNVNRAEDQKWWTCAISDQRKSMSLTVYTFTSTLEYDSSYSQAQDLVQNSITWKCSTGCAYPSPSFTWYYTESGGSRQEWSTSETVTNKVGACSDSERIYTSTLSLPRYTVFSDNTDKTVKFQCGAVSVTGKTDEKFTPTTVNVQFAVRVTSVILKDGDTTPSGTLEVTRGVPKTLTCTTSISRPTATVIWYIGNVEKKRSTDSTSTFIFTPTNSDHGEKIYCKAFNIQPENQAVTSNKPTLYVKVRVTSVILKDGNTSPSGTLQVTSGVPKTLTCTTSVSRPTATVIWYIGNVEKKRSTDTTSTFTFTPTNSDHGEKVYCKAFNIQPENQAVTSNEPTLYVKVKVVSVALTDGNSTPLDIIEVTKDSSKSLTCSTSLCRPEPTVIWYIGNEEKKRSIDSNSSFMFIPTKSDNGTQIFCKAFNIQEESQAVTSNKPTLYVKDTEFFIVGKNNQTNVIVDEYTAVQFNCTVMSSWDSTITLLFQDTILKTQPQTKVVSFIRNSVSCFHAGVYTCYGINQHENTPNATINLYVRCSPRPFKQIKQNFTSSLLTPVTLSFTTIAYPEPGPEGFLWHKYEGMRWTPLLSNTDLHISSSGLQSNLTISNVSRVDYGHYRVTVTNDIGSYEQHLFLEQEDINTNTQNTTKQCSATEKAGLITGISCGTLAIALAVYATSITVLLKRERSKKEKQHPDESTIQTSFIKHADDVESTERQTEASGCSTFGNKDGEDSVKLYTGLVMYSNDCSTYESIQTV